MTEPIERILLFIDGTEGAITAAQYAVCLSRATGAQLFALYVVNTRALVELLKSRVFLKSEQEEYQHDLEADADRYLSHVRDLARRKGVSIQTHSTSGTVHQEIKRFVDENDIDLLVLGELARIRSRREVFYDEAERAMRGVGCSVLIVKDEERVWQMYESLS